MKIDDKLEEDFTVVEVEGVRIGYLSEAIEGFPDLRRYSIAIEKEGSYVRSTLTCEEVGFIDKLKEIIFIQKLKLGK